MRPEVEPDVTKCHRSSAALILCHDFQPISTFPFSVSVQISRLLFHSVQD